MLDRIDTTKSEKLLPLFSRLSKSKLVPSKVTSNFKIATEPKHKH